MLIPSDSDIYAAHKAGAAAAQAAYSAVVEETRHPLETSRQVLLQILKDNADTEYGRRYDFKSINSIEDYQRRVPVIQYKDIEADLERMAAGEPNVLTAYPFHHINQTSGTVGKRKKVPMTEKQADMFIKYNRNYIDGLITASLGEDWLHGRTFCISEGKHSTMANGITIGSASSVMAEYVQGGKSHMGELLRTVYTSPVEASIPEPDTDTRYLHTRFALMDRSITCITAGFYIMILQYFQYISDNYEMLINDIETGTIDPSVVMPDNVRAALLARLEPMPERAAELREIFKSGSNFPFVPEVWPRLELISGVGKADFSVYDRTIKERFTADRLKNLYSGITASEGLFSVPVDFDREDAVIAAGAGFIEFLPLSAGDDFSRCLTADSLEPGEKYEIIITNFAGYYRCRMSDVVEVVSLYNSTPTVKFLYRRNRTVNLCGEKTTEQALRLSAEKAAECLHFQISDFVLYPDRKAVPAQYLFMLQPENENDIISISQEALAACLNEQLELANESYAIAIKNRRIQPLRACFLQPQTTFLYRDLLIMRGAPASQLKPVRILEKDEQYRFFNALRL